jgi:hypothetical protein
MGALAKIPLEMTLAEFLEWDAPGPNRWQLIAGVPEAVVPLRLKRMRACKWK